MADHFSRPLRLTRQRGARPVRCGRAELLATPGLPEAPALASAAAEAPRGASAPRRSATERAIATAGAGRPPSHLETLRARGRDHERLDDRVLRGIDGRVDDARHRARGGLLGHGQLVRRRVGRRRPTTSGSSAPTASAPRRPRERASSPAGSRARGVALFTPTGDEVPVRLRLRPGARWIAEYYATVDAEEHDDGSIEVTLPAARLAWVAGLLLRVGADAEVLSPPRRWRPFGSSPLARSHATGESPAERPGSSCWRPWDGMTRVG